jgi:hypothetical protein
MYSIRPEPVLFVGERISVTVTKDRSGSRLISIHRSRISARSSSARGTVIFGAGTLFGKTSFGHELWPRTFVRFFVEFLASMG